MLYDAHGLKSKIIKPVFITLVLALMAFGIYLCISHRQAVNAEVERNEMALAYVESVDKAILGIYANNQTENAYDWLVVTAHGEAILVDAQTQTETTLDNRNPMIQTVLESIVTSVPNEKE